MDNSEKRFAQFDLSVDGGCLLYSEGFSTMPLEDQAIEKAADALDEAELTKTSIRQLSITHREMTVADSYRIQQAWVQKKLKRGRSIAGHKIGLTSRVMQRAVNVNEPDYGVLLDDMFYSDGDDIEISRFIEPRLEVELAFLLKKALPLQDCTIFDVLDATEYVVPTLEILDARIQRIDSETGATRKILDTIADNAANAAIVVGGAPFKITGVDLRWVSAICHRNAKIEETGVAAAVLGHPANGIVWLAKMLGRHGVGLQPGQLVLSGSFIRPVDVAQGDVFHAEYGTFGTVSCRFR